MKIYSAISKWENKSALKKLNQHGEVFLSSKRPTRDQLIKVASEFDGLIIGRLEQIDKMVVKDSQIGFISIMAKGVNNIELEECKKRNISVFNTPHANIVSVAEHVFALILSLSKKVIKLDQSIRKNKFNKYRFSGIDLTGKTIGVIGAGDIAQEVIKRSKAFGMKVVCYTPHPDKHADLDVDFIDLKNLLEISDFVTIHIPLKDETENFLDKDELSLLKKDAYFVNTSRGKIVNEKALTELLQNKKIAGAGLDVFEKEPLKNSPLLELDNVILTPHAAGVTKDALRRMEKHCVEDIVAFLTNKKVKYQVV